MRTVRPIAVIVSVAVIGIALALLVALEWQRRPADAPQAAGQPAPTDYPPPPRKPLVPTQTPVMAKTAQLSEAGVAPAQPQTNPAQNTIRPPTPGGWQPINSTTLPIPAPTQMPSAPTPTTDAVAARIPPCRFPLAPTQPGIVTLPVSLNSLTLSEPRVVLTNSKSMAIAQWLPDSRRLLLKLEYQDNPGMYVETFDTQTGARESYGHWGGFSRGDPLWLATRDAVAVVSPIRKNARWGWELSIGRKGGTIETVAEAGSPYLSLQPDSQWPTFISAGDAVPHVYDPVNGRQHSLHARLSIESGSMLPMASGDWGREYRIVWHPNGRLLAVYSFAGFFIVDASSGQTCGLALGEEKTGRTKRWVMDARWSADSRYLALQTTSGDLPVSHVDLSLVDQESGAIRQMNFDGRMVQGYDWLPGSALMIVATSADADLTKPNFNAVYLADAETGEIRRLWPDSRFYAAGPLGIRWSPDAKAVAVPCPLSTLAGDEVDEWRICLSRVEDRQ